MNKERRKTLGRIETTAATYHEEMVELIKLANEAITAVNDKIAEVKDDLIGQLEEVRDEEQEYYDNMSESLQGGEKGDLAQEAVQQLEAAISFLEGIDDLDELGDIDLDAEVVQPTNAAAA